MHSSLLIGLGLLALAIPQNATQDNAERPPEVQQLITSLPECSRLRRDLEEGRYSDQTELPYMQAMHKEGVQCGFFEFEGTLQQGHPDHIKVVKRVYFKRLDGPDAQITDLRTLDEVKNSGLQKVLDDAVIERAKNARFSAGVDEWAGVGMVNVLPGLIRGSRVYGSIELFGSQWITVSAWDQASPYKPRFDIGYAAYIGDVMDLSKIFQQKKYSQKELNLALNSAVMSRWDNTAAIEMLIKAGADVNAKFGDDTTLLMLAKNCSCNIRVLLAHGARADDRDKWGRTALDLAWQGHDEARIRLLQDQSRDLNHP